MRRPSPTAPTFLPLPNGLKELADDEAEVDDEADGADDDY
jgi:hypothetical protein